MDKRENQISEMEDLIAQLNADKTYFEKELIDMQVKNSDMHDELKRKDKELYEARKRNEDVGLTIHSHLDRISELENGGRFCRIAHGPGKPAMKLWKADQTRMD